MKTPSSLRRTFEPIHDLCDIIQSRQNMANWFAHTAGDAS